MTKSITEAMESYGYTLAWKYDPMGNVVEETNALGERISRLFDSCGNKIEETDGSGTTTFFEYDASNRLVKETEVWKDGQTFITTNRYNLLSQKIASIDSCGQETFFFYDRLGRLVKSVSPPIHTAEGSHIHPTIKTLYNAMGQAIATCNANGQWTKIHYTIRGQPWRIEYPDGSIEEKAYSLDGLLVKETAKNGLMTLYSHDPFGRVLTTQKYSPEGLLLSTTSSTYSTFRLLTETDEAGNSTIYKYDGAGRQIAVINSDKINLYTYDAFGRVISEREGDVSIERNYDLLDRIVEERHESYGQVQTKKQYKYDAAGNCTHEIAFADAGIAVQETEYNPHKQPLLIRDALGNEMHFTYATLNFRGQTVRSIIKTDPLGNNEVKIFDTHQNVSRSWRANSLGIILQAEDLFYDAEGHPLQSIAEVYSGNGPTRKVITEWEYDSMGNMVRCIEAKGTPEQKSYRLIYNLNGEKESIIKPNGVVLHHKYDLLGRLERFTSSDNTIDYSYSYDINDNPVLIEDKVHGTANRRSYDRHDRLISETLDTGLTFSYTYDYLDRPLTITLPDQSAIHYHYNGHLLARVDRVQNSKISYSHHYSRYDQTGNLLQMQLPGNAGKTIFKHDLLHRVVSVEAPHWREHTPEKGFDPAGNLLQRDVEDPLGSITYRYSYDDLYQLTSEEGAVSHTYANDSLYNRISKDGQPYAVNSLNQLLQQTDESYSYDANGNLIAIDQGGKRTIFSYDALDRLIKVEKNDSITHYRYDSFHRRLSKTHDGLTTRFLYLKNNEIGSLQDTIKELRILGSGKGAEIGAAVAIELEGVPYTPIHDPYGNVMALLDLNGNPVAHYRYSAFGEEEIYGQTLNPWRYSSKRVDPETGFLYFGRRYYMPSIGRWLTPDPLSFADGPNLYAYVHNHPLTMIDPDGQFAFLIPIAISLAIDYCMPTLVAYAAEYAAAGAIGASLVAGVLEGYSDPISCVASAATYSMGDTDLTTFCCNRAGMLIGAAIACRPSEAGKKGAQKAISIAGRELVGTVISKAETTAARMATTTLKKEAQVAGQKTASVAKRYFGKEGVGKLGQKNNDIPTLLEKYLGQDSRAFNNNYKDLIIESKDGMKQFRIDLNHPFPHKNPHSHLIEYGVDKGKKFELFNERIYPRDVYPE